LGCAFSETKWSFTIKMAMTLFFALTTPCGICIGILMTQSSAYDETSDTSLYIQGIANSCAAGSLILLGLAEMLKDEFADHSVQNAFRLKCLVMGGVFTGIASMAVLANWA